MKTGDIELKWLGHSGILIKDSKIVYIDPYNIPEGLEKADIVLLTHSHYDHCSVADLKKIVKNGTLFIMPADCQSKVSRFQEEIDIEIAEPGKEFNFEDIRITSVHSYNLDKNFHPKEEKWVGYVIRIDDVVIYHAGDTDNIPEMKKLTGYKQKGRQFIAFLPVGGRFTMSSEEAFEASKIIKPDLAIPIHYGSIVGGEDDAKDFVELCKEQGINAKILGKNE